MSEKHLFCQCGVRADVVVEVYDVVSREAFDTGPPSVGCDYDNCVHRTAALAQGAARARHMNGVRGRTVAAVRLVAPADSLALAVDRYRNNKNGPVSLAVIGLHVDGPTRLAPGATVDLARRDVARVRKTGRFPEGLALVGPTPSPAIAKTGPRCPCGAEATLTFELYCQETARYLEGRAVDGEATSRVSCSRTCAAGLETELDARRDARERHAEVRALPMVDSFVFGSDRVRNAAGQRIAFVLDHRRYILEAREEADIPRRFASAAYKRGLPLEPVRSLCDCGAPAAVHFALFDKKTEVPWYGAPHLGCASVTCSRRVAALVDAAARAKKLGAFDVRHVALVAPAVVGRATPGPPKARRNAAPEGSPRAP